MKNKSNQIIAIGIVAIVGLLSFLTVYTLVGSRAVTPINTPTAVATPTPTTANQTNTTQTTQSETPATAAKQTDSGNFISDIFGLNEDPATARNETWAESALKIITRLFLAVILSALLAFRPRKNVPLLRRNLYVAQTQILLAVVAAALMMIVADNAARALAIFAAVSLVRFRTNIRDPKEITVLLLSLAIGLAMGVGRWELAIVLCIFVLPLLWLLEYKEPEQVFRAMELTVKTRDTERTQDVLKKVFLQHKLEAEVRELDPPDEANPIGCIMYYLNLRFNISTDQLSDQFLTIDPSIEGISWEQKKGANYAYP